MKKKLYQGIIDTAVYPIIEFTEVLGVVKSGLLSMILLLFTAFNLQQSIGWILTLSILTSLILTVALSWKRIQHQIKLTRYGKQKDNIYVRSRFPDDRSLVKRRQDHIDWLKKSANSLKVPPEVKIILFRDYNHPDESWEAYEQRFVEEVMADRLLRHQTLAEKEGEDWYFENMADQEMIQIEEPQNATL